MDAHLQAGVPTLLLPSFLARLVVLGLARLVVVARLVVLGRLVAGAADAVEARLLTLIWLGLGLGLGFGFRFGLGLTLTVASTHSGAALVAGDDSRPTMASAPTHAAVMLPTRNSFCARE